MQNREAIEKLQEMVDNIDIGMVCTYPKESGYVHAVPMSRQEVDEQGNIWFLFSSESETFSNLQESNKVSILFSKPSDQNYLNTNGIATISQDQERIDKYWNKYVEGWFEKGREDPRIRILKVSVQDAHYWDTKTNKLFTFFKVVASGITGSKMDVGREGSLDI